MIANKQKADERRRDRLHQINNLENTGRLEDDWDRTLEQLCGLGQDEQGRAISWASACVGERLKIYATMTRHERKAAMMAQRLGRIMVKEKALADQEKSARQEEKRQRRTARLSLYNVEGHLEEDISQYRVSEGRLI